MLIWHSGSERGVGGVTHLGCVQGVVVIVVDSGGGGGRQLVMAVVVVIEEAGDVTQ